MGGNTNTLSIEERKVLINEMINEDEVFIAKMEKLNEKGKEFLDNIRKEAEKIAEQTLKLDDDEAYRYMAEHIKRIKKNIVRTLRQKSDDASVEDQVSDDADHLPDEKPSYKSNGIPQGFKPQQQHGSKWEKKDYKQYQNYNPNNPNKPQQGNQNNQQQNQNQQKQQTPGSSGSGNQQQFQNKNKNYNPNQQNYNPNYKKPGQNNPQQQGGNQSQGQQGNQNQNKNWNPNQQQGNQNQNNQKQNYDNKDQNNPNNNPNDNKNR